MVEQEPEKSIVLTVLAKCLVAAVVVLSFVLPVTDRLKLFAASDLVELPKPHPSRVADRLSLMMRGVLATQGERQEYALGTISLAGLAEKYRTDERFAVRLAQHWAQVLKITAPFDFSMVEDSQNQSLLQNLRPSDIVNSSRMLIFRKPANCSASDKPRFELFYRIQTDAASVDRLRTRCQGLTPGTPDRQTCDTDLQREEGRLTVTNKFRAIHDCSCADAVDINPWWNPAATVRVCPAAVRSRPLNRFADFMNPDPTVLADVCGSNLNLCMPRDSRIALSTVPAFLDPQAHDGNRFFDEVITGLTLEPAMLIAKTIQENRDYREVLTGSKTVLPGAVETFLKSTQGSMILRQSAGQFENGSALNGNESERKSWRWIERGSGNAGVLTTPAFHQVTNGYRAKANRTYESFLCRKFIIPPGVIDGNPSEPDLTKRQPCASCHVELEPLGNMFKRWPQEGTNFLYNANLPASGGFIVQPQGQFENGEDVQGLARLFVKDDRFAECAVQRAFEFAIGREPSEYDIQHFFPKWKQKYLSDGHKVWPVMLDIIQSVYFLGGWK